MIFSSSIFLTLFLPIFLCIYYLTPFRFKSLLILTASYFFYAWWRIDFTFLFAGVTFVTYLISLKVQHTIRADDARTSKRWLTFGVVANLLTLAYFKYFNFGVTAWQQMTGSDWVGWHVILPIGVSFYVFHCISYLVDIYRKDADVAKSYWDFAAFTALFPHLIAGPVLRYKDLAWQFANRTHTMDKFNEGAIRFAMGFCKKVLIADTLAPLADLAFAHPDPTMLEAWIGILAYTAQLYFDFSGYSDMAVGLALMMGFRFIENFDSPYISRSITEFWRRWHISLSTWLRDYLYIPLGGNRKGTARTYLNLFLTMFLGGIWHGAGWTFVFWGAWHGGFLALERLLGGKTGEPYPRFIAWGMTVIVVMIGWVAFRAPNMDVAMTMWQAMFSFQGFTLSDSFAWQVSGLQVATLAAAYAWAFIFPRIFPKQHLDKNHQPIGGSWAARIGVVSQLGVMALFVVAVAKMAAQSYSPFLYFQF
jgi:alginate O-acetyltransferase complex protein AlgI